MTRSQRYGIRSLKRDFPDDNSVLEFMFDALHSRNCSCGGTYSLVKGRRQFYCSKCRFQIAPLSSTIFNKSTTSLTKWLEAILIIQGGSPHNTRQLQEQLGITYKCAWRINKIVTERIQSGKIWVWNVTSAGNKKHLRSFMLTDGANNTHPVKIVGNALKENATKSKANKSEPGTQRGKKAIAIK